MNFLKFPKHLTFCFLLFYFNLKLTAQNIGFGTNNPRALVHILNGGEGVMNFPYETLVVEKSEDSKLGIYSTSTNPVNYKASSITLGYTNYLDENGHYPSYEMQYGIWANSGFILRFNALARNAAGNYLANSTYSNVLCLDTKGHVGINLTTGLPVAPESPTANLHVNGTVRFQNLPPAVKGGNFLLVDVKGNVSVSSNYTPGRIGTPNNSTNNSDEIILLKQEIENLKTRLSELEQLA